MNKRTIKPAGVSISGFFLCLLFCQLALASPAPVGSRNHGLFSTIHGIPTATPADLIPAGTYQLDTRLNLSNTLLIQRTDLEYLKVDVELWRFELAYHYAPADDWMIGILLPLQFYTSGILDPFIDSFHEAFNLDEDIRPFFANQQIDVFYSTLGQSRSMNEQSMSLGDSLFSIGWQSYHLADRSLSYWLGIKLPTGRTEDLSGSGHLDISTWLSANRSYGNNWLYGQLGLLYISDSDALPVRHRSSVLFASLGYAYTLHNQTRILVQLDTHSELYRSELDYLGPAVQLNLGFQWHLSVAKTFTLSLNEDLIAGSAPDFGIILELQLRY